MAIFFLAIYMFDIDDGKPTKKKNSVKSDQCVSNFFLIAHSCCMYVNGTPNIMPAPLYLHLLYYTFILLLYILYKYIHIFFFSWLIYKKRKKMDKKKTTQQQCFKVWVWLQSILFLLVWETACNNPIFLVFLFNLAFFFPVSSSLTRALHRHTHRATHTRPFLNCFQK